MKYLNKGTEQKSFFSELDMVCVLDQAEAGLVGQACLKSCGCIGHCCKFFCQTMVAKLLATLFSFAFFAIILLMVWFWATGGSAPFTEARLQHAENIAHHKTTNAAFALSDHGFSFGG